MVWSGTKDVYLSLVNASTLPRKKGLKKGSNFARQDFSQIEKYVLGVEGLAGEVLDQLLQTTTFRISFRSRLYFQKMTWLKQECSQSALALSKDLNFLFYVKAKIEDVGISEK